MAEYKVEEILVIEPGSKCVTDSEPFEVNSQLLGTGVLAGIKKVVVGKGITAVRRYAFAGCGELCEVEISEGVIAAKRHIHFTPEDAKEFGVEDKQIVSVKIDTDGRSLVFGDVVVRVSAKFKAAMHIDTDESNAAGCAGTVYGEVIL